MTEGDRLGNIEHPRAEWLLYVGCEPDEEIHDGTERVYIEGSGHVVHEFVRAATHAGAVDRIEDLEEALAWALARLDRPDDVNAEEQENYDAADRLLGGQ
jgi:hypothetical protein